MNARFGKASMEKVARHRMREIKMWSKLKKEFNDGSFNDKDVNVHQLESYHRMYAEKAKTLNQNSSEAEVFNVMGQLQSLQRIKKSGELENKVIKRKNKLNNMENPKFDFVFLGQSILKYQVPDIFITINHIYENNKNKLDKANKQLVGKIENEHSLFYHGVKIKQR